MTNRFRIHGTLPRRLEELGVSPVAGAPPGATPGTLFQQSRVWVTTEEMFALYSNGRELLPASGARFVRKRRLI